MKAGLWRLAIAMLLVSLGPLASSQQFSDWSVATNLNSVNLIGGKEKNAPFLSKDGLSLFFSCRDCPGGYGGNDLYVSQRQSVNEDWGMPQNLGPDVNTAYEEGSPALSIDGHRLYFISNRTGGFGGNDIWVARRHNRRDDFHWRAPENLGDGVNSSYQEDQPSIFEDDQTEEISLYFSSTRPGAGNTDIYVSTMQEDETFGPATMVAEVSGPDSDQNPSISRDGLSMYITSNRTGSMVNAKGLPSYDIWVSTRASTSEPWSTPVNVDPQGTLRINSSRHDGGAEISWDGTMLLFQAAQRLENHSPGCDVYSATCYFEIWVTTRNKQPARDAE